MFHHYVPCSVVREHLCVRWCTRGDWGEMPARHCSFPAETFFRTNPTDEASHFYKYIYTSLYKLFYLEYLMCFTKRVVEVLLETTREPFEHLTAGRTCNLSLKSTKPVRNSLPVGPAGPGVGLWGGLSCGLSCRVVRVVVLSCRVGCCRVDLSGCRVDLSSCRVDLLGCRVVGQAVRWVVRLSGWCRGAVLQSFIR